MSSDDKLTCLWLVRKYLKSLGLLKSVKHINKNYPELDNIGKRVLKQYKKFPSIEQIVKYYECNFGYIDVLSDKQVGKTIEIEKSNVNKGEKKRKTKHEKKDEENVTNTNRENGHNLVISNTNEESSDSMNKNDSASLSVATSVQNRFKRIDESKYKDKLSDNRLCDNSYWNMKKYSNSSDDFASKAAFELGQVRGKGFRQEKAKKKRCSWKGNGAISTGVSSIQFSDSD